jgi:vacuolar protein sorting-associated protein 35
MTRFGTLPSCWASFGRSSFRLRITHCGHRRVVSWRHSAPFSKHVMTISTIIFLWYALMIWIAVDRCRSLSSRADACTLRLSNARLFACGVTQYKKVQSAGNVIPRLYLVLTVGSATLKHLVANGDDPSMDALPISVTELLVDMEAMCKGVQHPMRGLFLRAYLLQSAKLALDADRSASVSFLLGNFAEMNKLWVRMKYGDDSVSREQLADLVGKNLLYLAELVSFEEFRGDVLGKILEQVVSCRDSIAQTYLIECLTAAFPDEFQVGTIDQILDVLPKLDASVNMATVLGSMLDRLARYSETEAAFTVLNELQVFDKISASVEASIACHRDKLSGEAIVSIYGGMLSFADTVYPGRISYVDGILGKCLAKFGDCKAGVGGQGQGDGRCEGLGSLTPDAATNKKLVDLLCLPLEKYDLTTLLNAEFFSSLVDILSPNKKRELAMKVATIMPRRGEVIRDVASAKALFGILEPLHDAQSDENDSKAFATALGSIRLENPAQRAKLVFDIVEGFKGRDDVVRSIGPAAVSSALDGVDIREYSDDTLVLLVGVCSRIADAGSGATAVRLLLDIVKAVGTARMDGDEGGHSSRMHIVYECMEQACILLERALFESVACKTTLMEIISTLPTADAILPSDSRDMLHHKIASYCTNLLLRKDQCRAILALARVERDGPTVQARLRRAAHAIRAIREQDAVFAGTRTQEQLEEPQKLLEELDQAVVYLRTQGVEISDDELHDLHGR